MSIFEEYGAFKIFLKHKKNIWAQLFKTNEFVS